MNFTKPKKKEYSIISATCLSLTIHFIVGALLIFCLSSNLISSKKLHGINLVWISLNTGSKNSGVEIKKIRNEQPSPSMERTASKPANIEKAAAKPEASQIHAVAAKESVNTITLEKYDAPDTGAKEQHDNITGYRGANTIGVKTSDSNTLIAYPLYRENPKPPYPELARIRGYEGITLVFAEILPNGSVGEIKIKKSSGYAILDQSAVETVKKLWKFEPAKKSGNPYTSWVEQPIRFSLHNNSSQS